MSSSRESFSMAISPPPPSDLGSYSRSMHQHTKRQMEAASSQSSPRRSQSTQGGAGGPSALPNGVSRGRNADFGCQS